jgi:hypothetical protein
MFCNNQQQCVSIHDFSAQLISRFILLSVMNPDYSRGVGIEIEKTCFIAGTVANLWYRQFTPDVKWTNLQSLSPRQQNRLKARTRRMSP